MRRNSKYNAERENDEKHRREGKRHRAYSETF